MECPAASRSLSCPLFGCQTHSSALPPTGHCWAVTSIAPFLVSWGVYRTLHEHGRNCDTRSVPADSRGPRGDGAWASRGLRQASAVVRAAIAAWGAGEGGGEIVGESNPSPHPVASAAGLARKDLEEVRRGKHYSWRCGNTSLRCEFSCVQGSVVCTPLRCIKLLATLLDRAGSGHKRECRRAEHIARNNALTAPAGKKAAVGWSPPGPTR